MRATTRERATTHEYSLPGYALATGASGPGAPDGRGAPGVFPALKGNSLVTAPTTKGLTEVILHGATLPSTAERPERLAMPAFGDRLSEPANRAALAYRAQVELCGL